MGVGVSGKNNQSIAEEQKAKSTETAKTTSYQEPYKAKLVTGANRSEYLMRKITVEEEDTIERALSPGALLPSSINQKDLLRLAGKRVKES